MAASAPTAAETLSSPPVSSRATRRPFVVQWTVTVLVAEALGFGVAFGGGRTLALANQALFETLPGVVLLSALVGVIEGASLGLGQWLVMRQRLPKIQALAWMGATAVGAAACWIVGMVAGRSMTVAPPQWLMPVGVLVSGLAFGAVLGGGQWLVLRRHVTRSGRWILANALGWGVGLVACFLALQLLTEDTPAVAVAVVAGLAGAAMAILPAVATGVTFARLTET